MTKRPATTAADPSIWTGTTYVNLINPNPDEFHLSEIARGLSRVFRYNGRTRWLYSVAEHSVNAVLIFRLLMNADAAGQSATAKAYIRAVSREILMHDASEYVLGDPTTALKKNLPDFRGIEARMQSAIRTRFGVVNDYAGQVKNVDRLTFEAEKAYFYPTADHWPTNDPVSYFKILPPIIPFRSRVMAWRFTRMATELGIK